MTAATAVLTPLASLVRAAVSGPSAVVTERSRHNAAEAIRLREQDATAAEIVLDTLLPRQAAAPAVVTLTSATEPAIA